MPKYIENWVKPEIFLVFVAAQQGFSILSHSMSMSKENTQSVSFPKFGSKSLFFPLWHEVQRWHFSPTRAILTFDIQTSFLWLFHLSLSISCVVLPVILAPNMVDLQVLDYQRYTVEWEMTHFFSFFLFSLFRLFSFFLFCFPSLLRVRVEGEGKKGGEQIFWRQSFEVEAVIKQNSQLQFLVLLRHGLPVWLLWRGMNDGQ